MAKQVRVQVAESTYIPVTVNGRVLSVEVSQYGFRINYRSQWVSEATRAHLVSAIERIDADIAEKAARAKERAAKRENISTDLFFYTNDTLEKVALRGKHGRSSGEYLITRADGTKTSASGRTLLRDLTDAEQQEFLTAQQEYKEAAEAVKVLGTERSEANKALLAEIGAEHLVLQATYDVDTDTFSATYGEDVFTGKSLWAVEQSVLPTLVNRQYPFAVEGGKVIASIEKEASYGQLFKTKEEAEEYVSLSAKSTAAGEAFQAIRGRFHFQGGL